MKTEALIRAMAADVAPRRPVGPVLVAGLALLAAGVGAVALAILGVNPDLASLAGRPWLLLLRQGVPLLLALGAGAAALRLARPGAAPGAGRALLAAAFAVAALVVGRELALVPASEWRAAATGRTHLACLASVTLIGLPLLAGAVWALRRGATTRPRTSGALAGLLSGAIASAIYALHCTETSPLFYVAWYGLATSGLTALGALAGPRLLRW